MNDLDAINKYKEILEDEFSFTEQSKELKEIIKKHAKDNNDADAMMALGMTHFLSSEKDCYKEAHYWFAKAAELGKEVAETTLGNMYANGYGVEVDHKKAKECYEKAANKNHAPAEFFLGQIYEEGRGVDVDYDKAIGLYRRSAEKGYSDAMVSLAILHMGGRGCVLSFSDAKFWLDKAVKNGNELAAHMLSDIFHKNASNNLH